MRKAFSVVFVGAILSLSVHLEEYLPYRISARDSDFPYYSHSLGEW